MENDERDGGSTTCRLPRFRAFPETSATHAHVHARHLLQENGELKELSAFLTDALAAARLKARTTTLGREAAQQALVAQEKQLARERREKGKAQEREEPRLPCSARPAATGR